MIELSEAAAIAIHATVFLSRNAGEPQSLKTIAAASDVSENHLSKVLQKLAKAGIVGSRRPESSRPSRAPRAGTF